jgi:outer membrane murein-binding lipoprotein Lpp
VTKQLQPTGGKPDAKTAQTLKAEQERLSQADSLLREAGAAAQTSNEPACREKVKSARTLLRP